MDKAQKLAIAERIFRDAMGKLRFSADNVIVLYDGPEEKPNAVLAISIGEKTAYFRDSIEEIIDEFDQQAEIMGAE